MIIDRAVIGSIAYLRNAVFFAEPKQAVSGNLLVRSLLAWYLGNTANIFKVQFVYKRVDRDQ